MDCTIRGSNAQVRTQCTIWHVTLTTEKLHTGLCKSAFRELITQFVNLKPI